MTCPHCASSTTTRQPTTTALGYETFRCVLCRRTFTERTGTPVNGLCLHPLLRERLRAKRRGKAGRSWCPGTSMRRPQGPGVQGRWCYLSWAIDRDGPLVDSLRSAPGERKAAQRFLRSARAVVGRWATLRTA